MSLNNKNLAAAPPFWDCPDCGRELDWHEETLTWCDECGAEWQYGDKWSALSMSVPIGWAAIAADGSESLRVSAIREQAEELCRAEGWTLVPLYAYPGGWPEAEIAAEAAFEESGCKRDWPDDEPETIQRITQCMAKEIKRLRITDAEREAIDYAWCSVGRDDAFSEQQSQHLRETLERLLERHK